MKPTATQPTGAAAKRKPAPGAAPAARPRPAAKRTPAAPRDERAVPTKQAATPPVARSVETDAPAPKEPTPPPASKTVREADRPTSAPQATASARAATLHAAAAASSAAAKPKLKLVRDSFTMPQADFSLIQVLKERSLDSKRPVKKSELLRAGLHALAALDPARLQVALGALEPLKPGRPKKQPG